MCSQPSAPTSAESGSSDAWRTLTVPRAHIVSGALTPRRSSPTANPTRAASTSHSRACVSSGSTPSPIT